MIYIQLLERRPDRVEKIARLHPSATGKNILAISGIQRVIVELLSDGVKRQLSAL